MEYKHALWMAKIVKVVTFIMVMAVIALAGASLVNATSTISGFVFNDTGIPGINNTNVTFYNATSGVVLGSNLTNESGYYSWVSTLPNIILNISYTATGHNVSLVYPVVVLGATNQNKSINVTLVPSGGFPTIATISGTVIDSNGVISGANLNLNGTDGIYSTTTDVSGQYTIDVIGGSTYTVTASAALHNASSTTQATVAGGNYANVDFNLAIASSDTTPPGGVSGLAGAATSTTAIQWNWNNPNDGDLAYIEVWVDGASPTNLSSATTTYTASSLACGGHTLSAYTIDVLGNKNATAVTSSSITANACTTPPPPSPGGGSSTSSSTSPSSGSSMNIIMLDFSEANSFTKTIGKADLLRFAHDGESHYVSMLSISATTVTLKIRSKVTIMQLKEGDIKNVSVDSDADPDYVVKLDKIYFGDEKAKITIAKADPEPEMIEEVPVVKPSSTVEVVAEILSKKPALQKGVIISAAVAVMGFLLYLLFFVWV